MVYMDLMVSTVTQGLLYALLSYGIYITYKILDFPDLTVDGSFPLGAAVTAVALTGGMNPYLTLFLAMFVGGLAGLFTGYIHVKLNVRDLLAGIITMTGLFSINLQIAGSNLAIDRTTETIFTAPFTKMLVGADTSLMYSKFWVSLALAIIGKLVLDFYLKTKNGLLLRAVGDNSTLVTTLAQDKGSMKILGLVIANALFALCGSVVAQEQRAFSSTMGTGQMIFGLATVIIGTTIFQRYGFIKGTTCALVGSVLYKFCIQLAITIGLPANLLKLVTAILFLVVLVLGDRKKGGEMYA